MNNSYKVFAKEFSTDEVIACSSTYTFEDAISTVTFGNTEPNGHWLWCMPKDFNVQEYIDSLSETEKEELINWDEDWIELWGCIDLHVYHDSEINAWRYVIYQVIDGNTYTNFIIDSGEINV